MRRTTTKASTLGLGLILLAIASPAIAQHGAAKKPAGANPGAGHPGGSMPGRNPVPMPDPMQQRLEQQMRQQYEQQMRQQQKQEQARLRQQQVQAQQNHEKLTNDFINWRQEQGKSSSASSIPSNPAALKTWVENQQHRKALKKSYDPAFDEYRQFQESRKSGGNSQKSKAGNGTAKKGAVVAPKTSTPKPNSSAQSKGQLAQDQAMIGHLRTLHLNLHKADADYDGYRVKAMENIHQALKHLGSSSLAATDSGNGGGHLPQGQSDEILKEAATKLKGLESELGSGSGNSEHHTHARNQLRLAIKHLDTALSIR